MTTMLATFAISQLGLPALFAVCKGASSAIKTYTSEPPKASFSPASGQETLFDEDNWARILDCKEILYLVQPFISRMQTVEIPRQENFLRNTKVVGKRLDGREVSSGDPTSLFVELSFSVARGAHRLAEYLTTAGAGPYGSSPKAWNLNVSAAVEAGIQVLDGYRSIRDILDDADEKSWLGQVRAHLNLLDAAMLRSAEEAFKSIPLDTGSTEGLGVNLRLANDRSCLALAALPRNTIPDVPSLLSRLKSILPSNPPIFSSAIVMTAGVALATGCQTGVRKRRDAKRELASPLVKRPRGHNDGLCFRSYIPSGPKSTLAYDLAQDLNSLKLGDELAKLSEGEPEEATNQKPSSAEVSTSHPEKRTPSPPSVSGGVRLIGIGNPSNLKDRSRSASPAPSNPSSTNSAREPAPFKLPRPRVPPKPSTLGFGATKPQPRVLRYNMQVEIFSRSEGDLSSSTHEPVRLRVVHPIERCRAQKLERPVRIKDRIWLQDVDTGLFLARKKIADDEWSVGFGISEDWVWTITEPL